VKALNKLTSASCHCERSESHGIATPACRNATSACRHVALLVAMTTLLWSLLFSGYQNKVVDVHYRISDLRIKWMKNTYYKKTALCLTILIFSFFLEVGEVLSQPKTQEEKGPQIRLGEVTFQIREIESKPSPLKMLEIQVEIFNRSYRSVAPPNSIKVVVVPKEIKYLEEPPVANFTPTPEEVWLNSSFSPNTSRVLIIGFYLPEKKPESITFEIQINPPEGEKKMVTWEGSGN
jgi:hypothetical protein